MGRRVDSAVPILISAKDRPLYLWAALDSLYRCTHYPHRFTLLDMVSTDPEVRRVVAGFERRGMFDEVVWAEQNHPKVIWDTIWRIGAAGAPYLGYVESDVVIEPVDPCWLECLVGLMQRNPQLAMLGAAIDQDDFVDLETARRLEEEMPDPQLRALIKADSPERLQDVSCAAGADIFHPHNPAGRLLLVRNSALREVGPATDGQLHNRFRAAGYETGIATAVRHRHLSLLHIFDYPEYDTGARDRFMNVMNAIPGDLIGSRESGLSYGSPPAKPRPLSSYVTRLRSFLANVSKRQIWRAKAPLARVTPSSGPTPRPQFAERDAGTLIVPGDVPSGRSDEA
jgi:hypothetical protein